MSALQYCSFTYLEATTDNNQVFFQKPDEQYYNGIYDSRISINTNLFMATTVHDFTFRNSHLSFVQLQSTTADKNAI